MLLVDQARTVLREVKVLKEMASQQGRDDVRAAAHWFDSHSWTVPATAYYPYAAPDLSKAGNVSA